MLSYKEIEVPDIGDFRSVPVVEILVQEGESVEIDTPLITVKTGKGPMDVPSPLAGKVQELIVHVEDRVTKGSSILLLETEVDDPMQAPSRPEPELKLESDDSTERVWEIDPVIDPNTTEPRLPTENFEEAAPGNLDDFDEHNIPTLMEEVSPDTPSVDGDVTFDFTEPADEEAEIQVLTDIGQVEQSSMEETEEVYLDEETASADGNGAIVRIGDEEFEGGALENTEEPPAAAVRGDPEVNEGSITLTVPDIGDFADVEVIEVLVAVGDEVQMEDPLITLESDKATMDVPATVAGVVSEVLVRIGDSVSEGSAIVRVGQATGTPTIPAQPVDEDSSVPEVLEDDAPPPEQIPQPVEPAAVRDIAPPPPGTPQPPAQAAGPRAGDENPHASPGVRKFARELGVDLTKVAGKGPKGRILKEDIQRWVKKTLTETPSATAAQVSGGGGIPQMPEIDFSQFGEIETQPLSRIKRLTATNLSRAWLNVPHVTQHDEADITELESFRQDLKKEEATRTGARITMLSFLMKACVVALKEFPAFNASLAKGGENLILKRYYHMGIAVDTGEGLVVPVVRDVDLKSIRDLAGELGDISSRARERKLSPKDLQGASFTISSLGGIGGTAFTPIVNAPEVAILGVSRSTMKPVYENGEFVPRLILPMSLSYDHRVIDGAQAARFTSFLAKVLADVRHLLL